MAAFEVPITLVSGFTGSGKSTLLKHLRKAMGSRRPSFLGDDGEVELFKEIENAVEIQGADSIIIECSASLEPFFVAEYLLEGSDESAPPAGIRIDTIVTVVDASRFLRDLDDDSPLGAKGLAFDDKDDRGVAELLIEQVEFADVVVINKCDLVGELVLDRLEALLSRLNPRALLVRATRGVVEPEQMVGTGLFDMMETDDGAGWLAELQGLFNGEPSVAGVGSFSYVERTPFHPARFNDLLGTFACKGLVRAKGSVWIATRHHEIGIWSVAGRSSTLSFGGAWFAATPTREWPADERDRMEIMRDWVPPFGDRRQEIAFIGIDLNQEEIRARLNACLLSDEEMKDGPQAWDAIPDTLPDWHADSEAGGLGPDEF